MKAMRGVVKFQCPSHLFLIGSHYTKHETFTLIKSIQLELETRMLSSILVRCHETLSIYDDIK